MTSFQNLSSLSPLNRISKPYFPSSSTMCDQTKPERKCGGRPQNKKIETPILDKLTATNSPPNINTFANDVVFSLRNVELIYPNSPPSSSHQHHPKKKHSQRSKGRSDDTTVLNNTITTISPPPTNTITSDVFSVRNVEFIYPNSPPSSSHQHHPKRKRSQRFKTRLDCTTTTAVRDVELVNPNSPPSSSHQHHPKQKCCQPSNTRSDETTTPTLRNVELVNPNSPASSSHQCHPRQKRSQLSKTRSNDTTTTIMRNVELVNPNSHPFSSQQHHPKQNRSRRSKTRSDETTTTTLRNVELIKPNPLLSSSHQKYPKQKRSRRSRTRSDDTTTTALGNVEVVNPNSPPSSSHQHHQKQKHSWGSKTRLDDTTTILENTVSAPPTNTITNDVIFSVRNVELINPSSPAPSSHRRSHLKQKCSQQCRARLADTTTTISPAPTTTNITKDVVFSVRNVELISAISPVSSSHHHRRCLPRLPIRTSKSDPKPLPLAVSLTTDSFMLINAFSRVARVVSKLDAVVNVFCVHTHPNFSMPWQMKRQYSSISSGVVIRGRRVLTCAHSVEHYTHVNLRKRNSDTKYVATVLSIGSQCDIGEGFEFVDWVFCLYYVPF